MGQEHNVLSRAGRMMTALGIATGLGDGEEGCVRLSETLQPVLDMWSRPDLAFTRGDRLCTALATMAAGGVATNAFVGVKNASPNIIALFDGVMGAPAAGAVRIGLLVNTAAAIVAAADLGPALVRDTRLALGSGLATGRLSIIRGTPGAPGSGASQIAFLNGLVDFTHPVVLAPGYSLLVEAITENSAITGILHYLERFALPGELLRP